MLIIDTIIINMSSSNTTHGNMKVNEIKPQIIHNRPMVGPMVGPTGQEIKLSGTGCTMASSMMTSEEPRVELLSHYRYGGYGYHHLYPRYPYGYGYGYGYPFNRRGCYPYGCGLGPYSWFY